jgi:hypothetical protein
MVLRQDRHDDHPSVTHGQAAPADTVDRWLTVAVVILYVVLVLAGVTTSSIGASSLRADPEEAHTDTIGDVQWIRSDEYNVNTPIALSVVATGSGPTLSPLSAPAEVVQRYALGFFQSVAYPDIWLLRAGAFLPDHMVFAAYWWLPSLLVLLMMPPWFRLLGAASSLGWLAGALVVLAPSNWWWSFQPSQQMAFTLTGCVALLAASERFSRGQLLVPAAQAGLAGVLLAGLPSRYLPWAIVLGLTVLLATVLRVVTTGTRRGRLLSLGMAGGVAVVVGIAALLEGRTGLEALASTVYPGSRRASATAQPFDVVFGAPFLGELSSSEPVGTNASELSTAPNVAFLVFAVVVAALPRWPRRADLPALAVGGIGLVWLFWGLISLGNVGSALPVLSLVLPERAVQVAGILGVISLCLTLSRLQPVRWHVPTVAALMCGLVTAYAGSLALVGPLPEMRRSLVLAAATGVAVAVMLLVRWPNRWFPVVVGVGLSAGVVAVASPLQRGLADLRGSEAAEYVAAAGEQARTDGALWASDLVPFDVLMLANGLPSLSGLQRSGPDAGQWRRLDPSGAAEESWNRGGGYVVLSWDEGGPTKISDNGFDSIEVTVDPCVLAQSFPELSTVAAVERLRGSCLQEATTLLWSGRRVYVYNVVGDVADAGTS